MKVQSGKGSVQSQVKPATEDLSTQPPAPQSVPATDYFSSLINSMNSQLNAETEDSADPADDDQVDAVQAQRAEKQAGFDALFSALEFQYPALDVNQVPIQPQAQSQQPDQPTDFKPDVKAVTPATTPAAFNTNVIPEKIDVKNAAATIDIPVKTDLVQMQQDSSALPPAKEAEVFNAMLDLAVQKTPVSNNTQTITDRNVVAEVAEVDEPDDVSDTSETKAISIKFNGPTFNTETNSTQSVTLLSLLKGQTYQPDEQKNKYVDALVQMGSLINGETMRQFGDSTNQPGAMVMREASSVDYGEMISRAARPEYELKIDLLPLTAGSMANDVYTANIKIYPPELGAVIAKLKLDKKNAELIIVTENNRVKEVVEANLSQLKQQFQQSDINLTTIRVEVQTSDAGQGQQQQPNPQTSDSKMNNTRNSDKNNANKEPATKPQRLNSIIDTYI